MKVGCPENCPSEVGTAKIGAVEIYSGKVGVLKVSEI